MDEFGYRSDGVGLRQHRVMLWLGVAVIALIGSYQIFVPRFDVANSKPMTNEQITHSVLLSLHHQVRVMAKDRGGYCPTKEQLIAEAYAYSDLYLGKQATKDDISQQCQQLFVNCHINYKVAGRKLSQLSGSDVIATSYIEPVNLPRHYMTLNAFGAISDQIDYSH
jgi:hypothetical protein